MLKRWFLYLIPAILVFALALAAKTAKDVVPESACGTTDFSGVGSFESLAIYQGRNIIAPSALTKADENTRVLGITSPTEKWIEIDLSDQMLYAWDSENLFLKTPVSTGLPGTPTPTGEFRVWIKLRATRMEGGEGRLYYNLPNVPYVMFFENDNVPGWRGYGIHGTYWHNDFGTPHSHGCINAPTPVAEKLYYWSSPYIPEGKYTVYSDENNPGIRVIIHE